MIKEILENQIVSTTHSIIKEKEIYLSFDDNLPQYFTKINQLSKSSVVELIRSNKYDNKTKLLAILFWGIYFQVMRSNNIIRLINFLNDDDFEAKMGSRIESIINSENPDELFLMFSDRGVHKIPGLSNAYFTKLFFFYREALVHKKQTYPILDKWLGIAWAAIEAEDYDNIDVYKNYFKFSDESKNYLDGIIKRQKKHIYNEYIMFIEKIAEAENVNPKDVEQKLFGRNLKENTDDFNARRLYQNWASENNIPLQKPNEKKTAKNKKKNKTNKQITTPQPQPDQSKFYLINVSNYIAIRYSDEPKNDKKAGRIEGKRKTYLYLKEHLLNQINDKNNGWQDIRDKKTAGHFRKEFQNIDEAVEFLKQKGIELLEIK